MRQFLGYSKMLLWQSFGLATARNKADFVLRLLLPLVASGMFVAILYKTGMPVILIAFGLSLSVCAGIFCAAENGRPSVLYTLPLSRARRAVYLVACILMASLALSVVIWTLFIIIKFFVLCPYIAETGDFMALFSPPQKIVRENVTMFVSFPLFAFAVAMFLCYKTSTAMLVVRAVFVIIISALWVGRVSVVFEAERAWFDLANTFAGYPYFAEDFYYYSSYYGTVFLAVSAVLFAAECIYICVKNIKSPKHEI